MVWDICRFRERSQHIGRCGKSAHRAALADDPALSGPPSQPPRSAARTPAAGLIPDGFRRDRGALPQHGFAGADSMGRCNARRVRRRRAGHRSPAAASNDTRNPTALPSSTTGPTVRSPPGQQRHQGSTGAAPAACVSGSTLLGRESRVTFGPAPGVQRCGPCRAGNDTRGPAARSWPAGPGGAGNWVSPLPAPEPGAGRQQPRNRGFCSAPAPAPSRKIRWCDHAQNPSAPRHGGTPCCGTRPC
jgi:hypothetical protein